MVFIERPRRCLTNGTRGIVGIAASPRANLDHHRGLRVLVGIGSRWSENANSLAIDGPHNLFSSPVDRVGVEAVLVSRVVMKSATIVAAGVPLAKVVGLHLGILDSKPFPVNFVQVIGLHHGAADDSTSRGRFDLEIDSAEHDVPVGLDQRSVALLGNGEGCTICAVVGHIAGGREVGGFTRREVKGVVSLSKGGVRRTGCHRSAIIQVAST